MKGKEQPEFVFVGKAQIRVTSLNDMTKSEFEKAFNGMLDTKVALKTVRKYLKK